MQVSLIKTLKDIRFWIVMFFLIRLIGITNPPLETGHNWRQTTVTMVSRNFLEIDDNIFFPRIDIGGEKTGITGMEFPLLNYLIFLVAKIFGYQHWYGRLINLIVSSIGLWYFYQLILKYFDKKTAFYSTIVLTVSIWFQFSRKIMPDTFSMSMLFACIYYGTNYLENNGPLKHDFKNLIAYFFLMTFGVLSKLPSGYLLVIFLLFMFQNKISTKRKLVFVAVSLLGALPVLFWYFYWTPYLVDTYGLHHFFMGKNLSLGISEIWQNMGLTLSRFYDTALKYIGFCVFLWGLIYAIIKQERKIIWIFSLSFAAFLLIIFKSGFTFPHHNYYIIPFVPIMAMVAGYGLARMKKQKLALLLLIALSIEGIANQMHDFSISENNRSLLNLEKYADNVSKPNDLILINSGDYPTPMYFAHRKEWVTSNTKIMDEKYIKSLQEKGLKYIVILKRAFGTEIPLQSYTKVLDNDDCAIYSVSTP